MSELLNELPELPELPDLETTTCEFCSQEINSDDILNVDIDGSSTDICQQCMDNDVVECNDCSTNLKQEDASIRCNEYVCKECTENYYCCDRCKDNTHSDETYTVQVTERGSEEIWCESCTENNASSCHRCNDLVHDDIIRRLSSGSSICYSCYCNGDYFSCEACGDYDSYDDAEYLEDDEDHDYPHCLSCFRNAVPKVPRVIQSYSTKPTPVFKGDGELHFGFELEVEAAESNINKQEMATQIKDDDWYFKEDGSLGNGFEIVTHPMSFDYITSKREDIVDVLNKLIKSGYRSYDADTCGMHIHLSKKAFGTWHLYRFMKFFVENESFIISISQRKGDKLERWASIDKDNNGETELIYKAKNKTGNGRRYVAINLQNTHTVEIRIFRGTLNMNSFFKNIEFCYALFNFSRDEKDMTIDNFKSYIDKSNEYKLLKKFLKDKNL